MQKTRGWFLSILLYAVFAIYLFFLAVILFRSYTGIPVWNLYPLRTILEFITGFDYVTDPDLIDCCIYRGNAAWKRYQFLIREAKQTQMGT